MKKYLLVIFCVFAAVFGRADGGFAGAFLRMGLDARSESLGRAVSADKNNGFLFYSNPASLSSINNVEILSQYRMLSLDRKFMYIGAVYPLNNKNAGVAVGMLYTGTDDIEARDFDGVQFDTYSMNENMFHVSFAFSPKKFLSLGINNKILWVRLPEFDRRGETVSNLNFAFDIGARLSLPMVDSLHFGAVAKNIKGKYNWSSKTVWSKGTDKIDIFPTIYDFGVLFNPDYLYGFSIYGGSEISSNKNYLLKSGLEYIYSTVNQAIAFRMGNRDEILTFGMGYEYQMKQGIKVALDYAYVKEDITETNPSTISLRVILL
jgi:hypothetical protein